MENTEGKLFQFFEASNKSSSKSIDGSDSSCSTKSISTQYSDSYVSRQAKQSKLTTKRDKMKQFQSQKCCEVITNGIEEADMHEEESPNYINKLMSSLPCVEEEDKHDAGQNTCWLKKASSIHKFLDQMKICQVFPSEID